MKDVLEKLSENKKIESQWLNTLSLLELIGARKISKTVCDSHPSLEVLEHFADESRHAYAFKKLCHEINPQEQNYICPKEAIQYFQSLDQKADHWLKENSKNGNEAYSTYLLVTSLIERRAMKIYPLYKKITKSKKVAEELEKIIAEETNHRHDIEVKLKSWMKNNKIESLEEIQNIEEALFEKFEAAIFDFLVQKNKTAA